MHNALIQSNNNHNHNHNVFGVLQPKRNYTLSEEYKFGFNGKEMENHWNGKSGAVYDYGFRIYDVRIAKFLSVDPLADKYPSMSPYMYCAGNPMRYIDPDGRSLGDYYDDSGIWLGSDGKDDNKVYTASSVTKDDNGLVTSAENSQELNMTHDQFLQTAAFVYNEDASAMLETASAINNRNETGEYNSYDDVLNSLSGASNDNHEMRLKRAKYYRNFSNASSESRNNDVYMKKAISATIKSITSGKDYSNGAIGWQGIDVMTPGWKSYDDWQRSGFKWDNNAIISGSITPKKMPNTIGSSTRNYSYTITKSAGNSVFWKLNK